MEEENHGGGGGGGGTKINSFPFHAFVSGGEVANTQKSYKSFEFFLAKAISRPESQRLSSSNLLQASLCCPRDETKEAVNEVGAGREAMVIRKREREREEDEGKPTSTNYQEADDENVRVVKSLEISSSLCLFYDFDRPERFHISLSSSSALMIFLLPLRNRILLLLRCFYRELLNAFLLWDAAHCSQVVKVYTRSFFALPSPGCVSSFVTFSENFTMTSDD